MAEGGEHWQCYKRGSMSSSVCDMFKCYNCASTNLQKSEMKHACKSIIFKCEEHKHLLNSLCLHYCKSCEKAVCVYCIVHTHKDRVHELKTMEEMWGEQKSYIEVLNSETLNDSSERLLEKAKQNLLEKVHKTIADTEEETRKHKQKVKEILGIRDNEKDNVENDPDKRRTVGSEDIIAFLKTEKKEKILSVEDHLKNVFSRAISDLKKEIDKVSEETFS